MNRTVNLLHNNHQTAESRKKSRKPFRFHVSKKVIVSLLLCIGVPLYLLAIFVWAWYPNVVQAIDYAKGASAAVQSAQIHMKEQKFRTALADLSNVSTNIEGLRVSISIMPETIRKFPKVETQLFAVGSLLDSSLQLISAMQAMTLLAIDVLDPFLQNPKLSLEKLPDSLRRDLLKKIFESPPILQSIRAQIGLADVSLSQIPEDGVLSAIKTRIDPVKSQLPQIAGAIDSAIPAAELIPQLVGYPSSKTYLFLLQNNTELRPTGGFLGAYGIVKLKNGNIDSFSTDNSYNLDVKVKETLHVTPPLPLQIYNKTTQWFFRDSNWSPDFPTAARQAMWFYAKEGGRERVDGVIAITPVLIEKLLEITGPITVDKVEFTPENIVDELIFQVEKGYVSKGTAFENRKGVIGDLAEELIQRLMTLPRDQWPDLFMTIQEVAKERHLLFYSTDDELQDKIIAEGWGGNIPDTTGDYLAVFDANLASLKTDAVMKRSLSYKLSQESNGSYAATATLRYENTAKEFDWRTSRYRNYVRVLVPKGSRLIDATGMMANDRTTRKGKVDVSEDLGKTVFGTFVAIEPGETKELVLRYELPREIGEQIQNGRYDLLVQKQPGIDTRDLQMNLQFPRRIQGAQSLDNHVEIKDNNLIISGSLLTDRAVSAILFE